MRLMTTNAKEGSSNPFWIKFEGLEDMACENVRRRMSLDHGLKSIKEAYPGSGENKWTCLMSPNRTFSHLRIGQMVSQIGFELTQAE